MPQVFEAIYENGVIRPATPVVGLSEGQRVCVTTDDGEHLAANRAGIDDMACEWRRKADAMPAAAT